VFRIEDRRTRSKWIAVGEPSEPRAVPAVSVVVEADGAGLQAVAAVEVFVEEALNTQTERFWGECHT